MKDESDTRIIAQGRYIDLVTRGKWEYVQRKNVSGIVGIVPITDDRKLVLVEQYRPPVASNVIELPAGLVGDIPGQADEAFESAARRELLEETGYEASAMDQVCQGVISPGISDEQISFFLATGLTKSGPGGGDSSEDIVVHEVAIDSVVQWLDGCRDRGLIVDLKIYAALPFLPGITS